MGQQRAVLHPSLSCSGRAAPQEPALHCAHGIGFADPVGCVPYGCRQQQRGRLRGAAAACSRRWGHRRRRTRREFVIIEKVALARQEVMRARAGEVALARQEVMRARAAGAVVAAGRLQPGTRRAVGAHTARPQRAGGQAKLGQLIRRSFGTAKGKAIALCCLCVLHLVLHV